MRGNEDNEVKNNLKSVFQSLVPEHRLCYSTDETSVVFGHDTQMLQMFFMATNLPVIVFVMLYFRFSKTIWSPGDSTSHPSTTAGRTDGD